MILIVSSCIKSGEKIYVISKFDSLVLDTIKPQKTCIYNKVYSRQRLVNDSIFVSFGDKRKGCFLSKNIDILFNPDYYGESDVQFYFDPFKAKKGKCRNYI